MVVFVISLKGRHAYQPAQIYNPVNMPTAHPTHSSNSGIAATGWSSWLDRLDSYAFVTLFQCLYPQPHTVYFLCMHSLHQPACVALTACKTIPATTVLQYWNTERTHHPMHIILNFIFAPLGNEGTKNPAGPMPSSRTTSSVSVFS